MSALGSLKDRRRRRRQKVFHEIRDWRLARSTAVHLNRSDPLMAFEADMQHLRTSGLYATYGGGGGRGGSQAQPSAIPSWVYNPSHTLIGSAGGIAGGGFGGITGGGSGHSGK